MITSVTFDDTIPYRIDRRASRFEASDWSIVEEQPGRIALTSANDRLVVQSMPYTLEFGPDPEPIRALLPTENVRQVHGRRRP